MGAEYSHQTKTQSKRHVLYEAYGGKRKGRSGERCFKCRGYGRISIDAECGSCRMEERSSWSNYTGDCCSCNGYGRQTSYETCDDCFGRGYQ